MRSISIEEFHQLFVHRHTFVCSDFDVLAKRFKHISFQDIPEAWICEIDKVLSMMNQPHKIKMVSQVYGFLVVDHLGLTEFDENLLKDLEANLRVLDIDLHEQLKEGITLH
jgi:hypothetical protein